MLSRGWALWPHAANETITCHFSRSLGDFTESDMQHRPQERDKERKRQRMRWRGMEASHTLRKQAIRHTCERSETEPCPAHTLRLLPANGNEGMIEEEEVWEDEAVVQKLGGGAGRGG